MQSFWEANEISISGEGSDGFRPMLEFRHANFPTDLMSFTKGFTKPTPIQSQVHREHSWGHCSSSMIYR